LCGFEGERVHESGVLHVSVGAGASASANMAGPVARALQR
jgi:hypothetical protein